VSTPPLLISLRIERTRNSATLLFLAVEARPAQTASRIPSSRDRDGLSATLVKRGSPAFSRAQDAVPDCLEIERIDPAFSGSDQGKRLFLLRPLTSLSREYLFSPLRTPILLARPRKISRRAPNFRRVNVGRTQCEEFSFLRIFPLYAHCSL